MSFIEILFYSSFKEAEKGKRNGFMCTYPFKNNLERLFCVFKKEMSVIMTPKERHKNDLYPLLSNHFHEFFLFSTGPDVLQDTPVATINEPEDMKRKYWK